MERRRLLQVGALAGAATLTGGLRPTAAGARGAVDVVSRVLEGLPVARRSGGVTLTRPVEAGRFSALAFELPREVDGVHVRSRSRGRWSGWHWLPAATAHAPDPGGPEPLGRPRHVSELLWTAAAEAFMVATPAVVDPAGVRTHVLDALTGPVEEVGALVGDTVDRVLGRLRDAPGGGGAPARPRIVRRGQWGANESWRRGNPQYARPRRAILHHTATSNGYAADEVPAMLRSILYHHTQVRGWNDIGYNVLVDRFGRLFEGRHGGLDAGVVGAHAAGHNRGSIGVAVLGNHASANAPPRAQEAVADLLAWKYDVHEIPAAPSHRVRHRGASYPATCGHRDVGSTSCPGGHLYRRLPAIRRGIQSRS